MFRALDPDAFARRFGAWMAAACDGIGLTPIAVDGKAARRATRDKATRYLCVVGARATANQVALAQKSEVGVIPDLLRTLDLAGAIVTLDAAGCQVENAATIRDRQGHDLLAVKGNRPGLHAAVEVAHANRRTHPRAPPPPPPRPLTAIWEQLPPDHRRRLQRRLADLLARPLTAASAPPREGRHDHPRT